MSQFVEECVSFILKWEGVSQFREGGCVSVLKGRLCLNLECEGCISVRFFKLGS